MVKANSASSIATEVGQPLDDQPRALKNESALRSDETELQTLLASHAEAIVAALGRGDGCVAGVGFSRAHHVGAAP
jgi:precorrin-6B methylase 1